MDKKLVETIKHIMNELWHRYEKEHFSKISKKKVGTKIKIVYIMLFL